MASFRDLREQANPEDLIDNTERVTLDPIVISPLMDEEGRVVLNPNTILSSFNDKLTLLKWLKKLIGDMEDIQVSSFTWDNKIETEGRFRLIITYASGEVQYSDYLSIPSITSEFIDNLFL